MPETDPRQTELPESPGNDTTEIESGFLHIADKTELEPPDSSEKTAISAVPPAVSKQAASSPRVMERPGTTEHLAARRPVPEIDAHTPEIKQQLAELGIEVTRLLTALRWEGKSPEETADRLIPMLNVGSIQQWKPILLPFLHEIDRAGNLLPTWLNIIERGDPPDLPTNMNPAETKEGRARRFAILMLGYHKTVVANQNQEIGFSKRASLQSGTHKTELLQTLKKLVTDPNTSMYAAEALAKQGTNESIQLLIEALKDAEGWAKVDIIDNCAALKLESFYDILVASGIDRVPGLESYVAIPIYRTIPLESYLRGQGNNVRLTQQAALIVNQVLQDSLKVPKGDTQALPPIFERKLQPIAQALFEGARSNPLWQNTLAVHRLGVLLGRYWIGISNEEIKTPRIIEGVYPCLPMMVEVERWMAGPGRDVLLTTLQTETNGTALTPIIKILGEIREPRAISPLLQQIEKTQVIEGQTQALSLGTICDTLGLLGDRRAISPLEQLLQRVVDLEQRGSYTKRRDNLPSGDAAIPGSIVYAAIVRAFGQTGDTSTLPTIQRAINDFDPYVRTQALEAVKRLDPRGEDIQSRLAARAALDDPREAIVRAACQLIVQYRDVDAASALRRIIDDRPELTSVAYDTLRQIGQ